MHRQGEINLDRAEPLTITLVAYEEPEYLWGFFIRTRQIIKALCALGNSVNIIELGYPGTRLRARVDGLESGNTTYLTINCVAQAPSKSIGLSPMRQLALQVESLKTLRYMGLLRRSSAIIVTSCLQALPALVSKLLRVQVVLDINDVNSRVALRVQKRTTRILRYLLWRPLEGFVCELAGLILVNKEDEKEFLCKHIGVKQSKILVVNTCLVENEPDKHPKPRPDRFRFGNKRVVLFLANMTAFMNRRSAEYITSHLALTFSEREKLKNVLFVLAGVGSDKLSYSTSNVMTTGTLDDQSVQALVDRADICIDPASVAGGVKTKIQYYLKKGKVIVTTPEGAEGINLYGRKDIAFLKTPIEHFDDKLIQALQDLETLKKLAVNNREIYERQFSWNIFLDQMSRLTQRVSQKRQGLE